MSSPQRSAAFDDPAVPEPVQAAAAALADARRNLAETTASAAERTTAAQTALAAAMQETGYVWPATPADKLRALADQLASYVHPPETPAPFLNGWAGCVDAIRVIADETPADGAAP